jgi:hypothetical protein
MIRDIKQEIEFISEIGYIKTLRKVFKKDEEYIATQLIRMRKLSNKDREEAMVGHLATLEAIRKYENQTAEQQWSQIFY